MGGARTVAQRQSGLHRLVLDFLVREFRSGCMKEATHLIRGRVRRLMLRLVQPLTGHPEEYRLATWRRSREGVRLTHVLIQVCEVGFSAGELIRQVGSLTRPALVTQLI